MCGYASHSALALTVTSYFKVLRQNTIINGGGFSVSNATLNRFFSLHYILPFVLAALAVAHMIALHVHGSNNPNGLTSNGDRYAMYPYFVFKDLVTIFAFFLALSVIVFFYPNALGHSDNYIPANPMVTPSSIVPE